jgi:CubicO group peptidase (beta-lactamase class C family)
MYRWYINSGLNVLGAIIRDRIERRGLLYYETLYGLLADPSAWRLPAFRRIAGNLIASGAGFATLRNYAKLGVLYLQNGMWGGERLLPQGWADHALTATYRDQLCDVFSHQYRPPVLRSLVIRYSEVARCPSAFRIYSSRSNS